MSIIDISVPLNKGMPVWPGSIGVQHKWVKRMEGGGRYNHSTLNCDVHLSTHIDAPLHFIKDGESIDQLSPDILCGPVQVIDLTQVEVITKKELSSLDLPKGMERLLFKTKNSVSWRDSRFNPEYVALTEDAARWIVKNGIRLVGIDYLSIAPYHNSQPVHRVLLGARVIVVEGLNLAQVQAGEYELICLPLKLMGAEGSPARAILRTFTGATSNGK